MADMMQMGGQMPPRGGQMPSGGGEGPMKMSVLNPTDVGLMRAQGTLQKDMTTGDFIEKVLKVPLQAPVKMFLASLSEQLKNATGVGKMKSMAGGGQPPQAPSQPPAPPVGQQPGGLEGLMNLK